MTKEEVVEVIKRNIVEILDDLELEEIDPFKSVMDYGADSLDVIQMVSTVQRELNIHVPRAELMDVDNIDELADRFMKYLQ